ncbi:hypothetical protein B0H67DRAFT_575280 [Lasiosphaeris hirsuta]|uniref:Uncharacterized protein n=1 Tax=Lasiosphaeris hirsuta TaxID=260670 RepID=A0AA40AQK7_9PEZI|nr:hypothetical protein B0H67DRAFT_575280 [Lasiosphaeris hirsuta]
MSDPNIITATEDAPEMCPDNLGSLGRMRWGKNHPPKDPTHISFAGKTVLVTGANTGLGFEAAIKYSALGADKLILGVRSAARGEAAKAQILARTGRKPDSIAIVLVDLADYDSVRAFVPALEKELAGRGLDVALLNAGLVNPEWQASKYGWEMAVQVNVISTALMTILLLPLLRETAAKTGRAPHLTFVNSNGHSMVAHSRKYVEEGGGTLLKAANGSKEQKQDQWRSYCLVKLLAMSIVRAVAKETEAGRDGRSGPEIIVNSVCPGLCKTDLGRNFSWLVQKFMLPYHAIFARSGEEGGRALVSATVLGPESHGRFWHNDILQPVAELVADDAFMAESWSEIMAILKKAQPDLHL